MRVINEVKAENEKMKSLLRSQIPSGVSTPRTDISDHSVLSRRGGAMASAASRGKGGANVRPKPLDYQALVSTPCGSERSTQSAPAFLDEGFDAIQSRYSAHPLVQDLVRGAPLHSSQREAQAGVKPRPKLPTGPLSKNELDERLQRRATMSMLYAGAEPVQTMVEKQPPTRAKPTLSGGGSRPTSGTAGKPRAQGASSAGDPSSSMVNRNVVRDLASFYDKHVQQQQQEASGTVVPWEMPAFDIPVPAPSGFVRPSAGPQNAFSPSAPPVLSTRHHVEHAGAAAAPTLPNVSDRMQRLMQQRPYDFGPPLSQAPVYSHTAGVSDYALRGIAVAASSKESSSTVEDFVVSHDEDRLHQIANEVLRSSQDKSKWKAYTQQAAPKQPDTPSSTAPSTQKPVGTFADDILNRYLPPPPPSLPADFLRPSHTSKPSPAPTGLRFAGASEGTEWQASPTKQTPRQASRGAVGSSHRPPSIAGDLSVDGEDVGALLQWASSLDTRDVWGRSMF